MSTSWLRSVLVLLLTVLLAAAPSLLAEDLAGKGPGKKKGKKSKASQEAEAQEEAKEEKWSVSEPPGTWQTIALDTDETTWSNVDVSPDGETLIFDMLGDIYSVPIGGGSATALTSGIEWNFQPRFSPDGSRIAFISDRDGGDNLWTMAADGSDPKALSKEKEHLVHNPSWSPDGHFLLAKKGYTGTRSIPGGEIWMFHSSGGGGLQIVERSHGPQSQKNIAEPVFSPDGRYIYYSQDTTPGQRWQYNKDSTGQIFVVQRLDRDTGETEVFVSGPGGAVRPIPSPDGRYLAFVKRLPGLSSALYLKDLESGKEWAVYEQLERDLQETDGSMGNHTAYAWTPDSRGLVFWAGGKIRRVDIESRQASVIPIRVQAEKKIRPALRFPVDVAPQQVPVRMLRWAQMSPDGSKVAFQALGHIYIKDLASGEQRRLTSQEDHYEFYPVFSRDGQRIAFVTWDDQELGSVRTVDADGGNERVLTTRPGHYLEPCFSPDGSLLTFRKITGGFLLSPLWSVEPGIYRVATSGSEPPERILQRGVRPHFGADNDRFFFSDGGPDAQLLLKSANMDGLEERTHFRGNKLTEVSVSPDGRWVAFTEQWNAYLTPFAQIGKVVDLSSGGHAIPVRKVSKRSGEFLHWSADSEKLHWAHGATLFTRELKDAFGFLADMPKDDLPEPVTEGLDLSFEVAADRPSGTIALTGGRLVTMRQAGEMQEVIENGTVLVEGDRIVAVGPADDVEVPAGAFNLDVSGKTVIPGLVDVHAHGAMARAEITPQQNWMQLSNLAFGVTTVHDPSNDTSSIFAAAELQRTGQLLAPRIFSTGTILYGANAWGIKATVESYEDAEFHVQRLKDVGAISVKSYQQPRRDQRQQIIEAGDKLGIMVVPEGGAKFQHNLTEIIDGHTGLEHAIPIPNAYEDVRQLWSQSEVGYSPTFGVAYGGLSGETYWYDRTEVWKNERLMRYSPRFMIEPRSIRRSTAPDSHYNHFDVAKTAKALRDRGVPVLIGAHGQREGLAAHWEIWMMAQGGFTPWEALRGATIDGAWYVGLDHQLGSLEAGKLADLAIIDGNPLTDIRRSEYVAYTMIGGRLYDTTTMNQIGNETTERQPLFFELEGGDTIHPATLRWLEELRQRHGWVH